MKTLSETTSLEEDYELVTRPGGNEEQIRIEIQENHYRGPSTEDVKRKKCYECRNIRHWAAAGSRVMPRRTTANGAIPSKCFGCGKEGRFAFECPRKKGNKPNSGSWREKPNVLCEEAERCTSDVGETRIIPDLKDEGTRWKPYAGRGFQARENDTRRTQALILRDT